MRCRGVLVAAVLIGCAVLLEAASTGCSSSSSAKYATKKFGGTWRFTKDGTPTVFRGVSMTGWETGTRETESGGGFWLFECKTATEGQTMMKNIVDALVGPWKMNIIRMPICGSAWLQNYAMQSYMGTKDLAVDYHTWVSTAVCYAAEKGMATIIDNHLWAIAKETTTVKNQGVEDGCTGYQAAPPDMKVNACAPKDWFGAYTSQRTGKSYNSGDAKNVWQCPIANADGVTLDTLFKTAETYEHFLNLWYDVATYFKGNSAIWFELFNEPYERKSADFGIVDPLGPGLGANVPEADYKWAKWSQYNDEAIAIIRKITPDQIILVSGHDWSYDYLGDASSATAGPLIRQDLIKWTSVANIGYAFHPYQHGTCCGKIGTSTDESKSDPYQSAYCFYAPQTGGKRTASNAALPSAVGSKTCDTIGYADTQNKKGPPCIWKASAKMYPITTTGVCAGDRDECAYLDQTACNAKAARWFDADAGGWSKYVLPMQIFGPLIATEFGPFDCSSPFSETFVQWCRMFGVSYTVWALWPQNSGGPGAGACGYPSILAPNDKGNFVFCASSCSMEALPWSAPIIKSDIAKGQDSCDSTPCQHGACVSGSCKCKTGFSGSKCETRESGYTVCGKNPCLNGGTCVAIGPAADADTYICNCPKQWYGVRCAIPTTMRGDGVVCGASVCKNGGTCVSPTSYQLVCHCPPGKNTPDCGDDALPEPGGETNPDKCTNTCKNGGVLGAAPTCACDCTGTGYSGDDCGTKDQKPDDCTLTCKNGGTVTTSCTCSCKTGYTGDQCQNAQQTCTLTSTSCGSHGTLNSADCSCTCKDNYSGQRCTVAPGGDFCSPDPCNGNGVCQKTTKKCVCIPGWEGDYCDKETVTEPPSTVCGSVSCINGQGACVNSKCKCFDGFSGAACQIKNTQPSNNTTNNAGGDSTLLIVIIVLLALIVLGGLGYYCYRQQQQQRFMQTTAGMKAGPPPPASTGYATGYGAQPSYRPPPPPGPPRQY